MYSLFLNDNFNSIAASIICHLKSKSVCLESKPKTKQTKSNVKVKSVTIVTKTGKQFKLK